MVTRRLGCAIEKDYPGFVSFNLGAGSSSLALYEREAAAADAGVAAEGSGFRGVSFHFIVESGRPACHPACGAGC